MQSPRADQPSRAERQLSCGLLSAAYYLSPYIRAIAAAVVSERAGTSSVQFRILCEKVLVPTSIHPNPAFRHAIPSSAPMLTALADACRGLCRGQRKIITSSGLNWLQKTAASAVVAGHLALCLANSSGVNLPPFT